jgi:hypothetical protein
MVSTKLVLPPAPPRRYRDAARRALNGTRRFALRVFSYTSSMEVYW